MTDLGEMNKILGIQVTRDCKAGTLKIAQSAYIDKILAHFNMADANLVATPLSKNILYCICGAKSEPIYITTST